MPPQTHLTAETARDAAPLGLVRTVAAKANVAAVQAAPRPNVPTAALRVVSDKDAAAPPGAAAGRFSWLGQSWQAFQESRRRRKMRVHLRDLSEAQLLDIGLSRSDIEHLAAHRALERLKFDATHLMMSRGVM
ncbi:conserved hypothetical protein [Bradyrhizobium sp. ORS 375]|uniref:DUF1127 domain-containing protein n=1 Tax=Bradyrhizobium sp. (strain ORS 375) TaxID=566679 RepID=UPI0002405D5D|nr:DUF1127 domain-containing protein [Bradyrhizobium sp. ORS 375]CCD91821.1 conserved hypothetical protein [Bradyrhizobium sp. ORS 375]